MDNKDIFAHIDHTLLKATASFAEVRILCEEAKKYGMASVCIPPSYIKRVKDMFPSLCVCTVIGFPLGYNAASVKVWEAKEAIADGASEIDMVINISALKDKDYSFVEEDIRAVAEASGDALVKVIIETCLLTDEEKVKACELSVKAGAAFVKTSTGFSTGGATAADVALMKKTVDGKALVKASGGIRTPEDAKALIEAGADRIGAGNGIPLIQE